MAQNENYSQVDLRIGTEAQFNAKVDTLPAGTLFGITDATVSKADLSTDLKNEINGKINKPANPTSDSAVVINSSGAISTKSLASITGKLEVAVSSTAPTEQSDEILWINPDGTSGGGGSSGGGKLYKHTVKLWHNHHDMYTDWLEYVEYRSNNTPITDRSIIQGEYCYIHFTNADTGEELMGFVNASIAYDNMIGLTGVAGSSQSSSAVNIYGLYEFENISDYVTEV